MTIDMPAIDDFAATIAKLAADRAGEATLGDLVIDVCSDHGTLVVEVWHATLTSRYSSYALPWLLAQVEYDLDDPAAATALHADVYDALLSGPA